MVLLAAFAGSAAMARAADDEDETYAGSTAARSAL
jgi:hypothetical protein